ncbi:hypothetical protein NHF45_12840 [Maricaulaceae bacterium NA33B04]|nr:hypothetical protein [Maricaulaceae bacterium NA33B04]
MNLSKFLRLPTLIFALLSIGSGSAHSSVQYANGQYWDVAGGDVRISIFSGRDNLMTRTHYRIELTMNSNYHCYFLFEMSDRSYIEMLARADLGTTYRSVEYGKRINRVGGTCFNDVESLLAFRQRSDRFDQVQSAMTYLP